MLDFTEAEQHGTEISEHLVTDFKVVLLEQLGELIDVNDLSEALLTMVISEHTHGFVNVLKEHCPQFATHLTVAKREAFEGLFENFDIEVFRGKIPLVTSALLFLSFLDLKAELPFSRGFLLLTFTLPAAFFHTLLHPGRVMTLAVDVALRQTEVLESLEHEGLLRLD